MAITQGDLPCERADQFVDNINDQPENTGRIASTLACEAAPLVFGALATVADSQVPKVGETVHQTHTVALGSSKEMPNPTQGVYGFALSRSGRIRSIAITDQDPTQEVNLLPVILIFIDYSKS